MRRAGQSVAGRPGNQSDILVCHFIANREAMTTFGATASKNLAPILGGHARAKAVLVDPFTITGLESALHDQYLG